MKINDLEKMTRDELYYLIIEKLDEINKERLELTRQTYINIFYKKSRKELIDYINNTHLLE